MAPVSCRILPPCIGVAALLAGCAVSHFGPDPPAGVTLAGAWKLDHGASDDPQKLLERMRQEAYRRLARRPSPGGAPRPDSRGGATRGGQSETSADADNAAALPPGPHHFDPLQRSPMAHVILEQVARGDYLTVRQGPGEFVLDYGTSQRSFTPGARSVVSAEGGVGDQNSGWKGRDYLIEVRAQLGPDVTERYSLSPDGKHLIEKLHIGAEELSAVDLTRVYAPTNESAPRQLPNND